MNESDTDISVANVGSYHRRRLLDIHTAEG
jgi:hypothetical protein